MNNIKHLKIEILCVIFGLWGIIFALNNKAPEAGLALSSTAITSYFAFKKTDDGNLDND
jgi:hypothetical protein